MFQLRNVNFLHALVSIGNGNRDHETSSTRGRLEHFTTKLSNPDLDRLLNKVLQAPSIG